MHKRTGRLLLALFLMLSTLFSCTSAMADSSVVITKNPTSEAIAIGGKTWFIAHAANATGMTWELVDPNGSVHSLAEAMSIHPGLNLQALEGDTIAVSNVPQSVNGWGVQATFYGAGGSVSTSPAYLYVGDFLTAYAPVLQTYRDYLNGVPSDSEFITPAADDSLPYYILPYEYYGVSLCTRYATNVGYYLKDLNKDGIPELLIGGASTYENYDHAILDLFTLAGGQPQRLLATSERVVYKLRSDNMISHRGSGGASYLICSVYKYIGTGFETIKTAVMDGRNFSITTGNNPSVQVSESQFWQTVAEFEDPVIRFAVTAIK